MKIMKNLRIKYLVVFLFTLLLSQSCQDNFLDMVPLDANSEATFFTKASDLKNYVNGMYSIVIRNNLTYNRWSPLDDGSDDYVGTSPNGNLMRQSSSGQASETSSSWNNGYTNVRKVNYFLMNAGKVAPSIEANHYIGEGYFIRAWVYFGLLQQFGGVPYITELLETNSEELYRIRDSRDFVAAKIIEDLDKAIENLQWKGVGAAKEAGRINKESALTLKTRVALYEGTWERNHGAKNTPFAVSGKDGSDFLQATVTAGDMLIAHQGLNIYKGRPGWEYNELWDMQDYSEVQGAFLYKVYSFAFSITNDWYGLNTCGWDAGITKQCIDQYLAKDGKPVEISSLTINPKSMSSLGENKDPRFGESVWYPAKGTFKSFYSSDIGTHAYNTTMPGVILNQQRSPSLTGYRIWKGAVVKEPVLSKSGETDDLILRYGEALLNYIEAKSLLGSITQSNIDKTVNVLRSRVDMAPMNLGEVNSWAITYNAKDGYDVAASNIVNEIRRERRVELFLEGFRSHDIKRWALMNEVYNGMKPKGAYLQEFLDYWNDP
ncbi:MAG: RagB/SusD family nutrient uptake outer membrane protein, partial [Gammaproteobacteria bacterium]|nr:RagB/SusD family nutrient uptake outer membrane protein [Gammaproteobacteria bacterium]